MDSDLLPDLLQPGLKIVFCGTAAGRASAEQGSYYAHPNNKFWSVLAETGLTDRKLKPHEFNKLINFGIGLTDLCKKLAGNDREVPRPTDDDREALRRKIEINNPGVLAFTSLEAGKRYFKKTVKLGAQAGRIADTAIYVLPSTSLMAGWNWEATKSHWHEFARSILV
jgi:TDG/mug DNA glycosylase family protein